MTDTNLRALERMAAAGDPQAMARLERARERALLRTNPLDNPLLEFSGGFVRPQTWSFTGGYERITDAESAQEDRWSERYSRASPELFDLVPIPYTEQTGIYGGGEDALNLSNRARIMADHGGACCAESIAEPDACSCQTPDPGEPCTWLRVSRLIGGGLLVAILPEPCGCQGDPDDPWECERTIAETISSLDCYPLLDDCLHSRCEMHLQMEAWRDYAADDFRRELEKAYPDLGLDDLDLDRLVWGDHPTWVGLCEDSGAYPEGSADMHWPTDSWLERVTPGLLRVYGATD